MAKIYASGTFGSGTPTVGTFEVPVAEAPWIPLSACYPYDEKSSLDPTLYQYSDGYSFFDHAFFHDVVDVKAGKHTLFNLTSSKSLEGIISDQRAIDATDLVIFTGLQASNGNYLSLVGTSLYATATSVGPNEFFKITKNEDGTYKIGKGTQVFTVDRETPWDITLEDELNNDTKQTQKFNVYLKDNALTIETLYEASWWDSTGTPPQYINRFWATNTSDKVQAIGMIFDDDYNPTHNYVFRTSSEIGTFIIGYNGIVNWVRYYNEIDDKTHNSDVVIEEIIEDVKANYLIDLPYKTRVDVTNYLDDIKTGKMQINFAALKNVMTSNYDYRIKS